MFRRNSSNHNNAARQGDCLLTRSIYSVRGPLADKEASNVPIRPSMSCAIWHMLRFRMSARFFIDSVRIETYVCCTVQTCNCRSAVHSAPRSVYLNNCMNPVQYEERIGQASAPSHNERRFFHTFAYSLMATSHRLLN
jgi:hypothetical protein